MDPRPLLLRPLALSDDAGFRAFYDLYAEMFPIEDERETLEGFLDVQRLVRDPEIQKAFGPYHEVDATAHEREGGPVVGGRCFGFTSSTAHHAAGVGVSIQGIYIFLRKECRGRNFIETARNYAEAEALRTFGLDRSQCRQRPLMFLEVNNPLRMTKEEIQADVDGSGLHPAYRYQFWRRKGFAPLDFPYVQPPLQQGLQSVRCLDLFCSVDSLETIPGQLLINHLYPFMSISVLKGKDARKDENYKTMESWLSGHKEVRFKPETCDEIRAIEAMLRQHVDT